MQRFCVSLVGSVFWKGDSMDFRPLDKAEQQQLGLALKSNVEDHRYLKIGADTGFAGTAEEVTDEEVISAIRSVPCHYSR
jgi:hypothetical protein